jgi:hypothetical protein
MAKQRNPWDIHPQKKPRTPLSASLKAEVQANTLSGKFMPFA